MTDICVISTGHQPLDDRIYYREAYSLRKVYNSINFIMPGPQSITSLGMVEVNFIPIKKADSLWSRLFLIPIIVVKAWRLRPRVCHVHDYELIFALPLLRLFLKCRIIYDAHEDYPEMARISNKIPQTIKPVLVSMIDGFEKSLVRFADCIIAADNGIAERFKGRHNNTHTFFNYPNLSVFLPDRKKVSKLKRRYQHKIPIIYQGSFSTSRGLFKMLEAMKTLKNKKPEIILLLVGSISDDLLIRTKEEIITNGLEANIDIVGLVSHTELVNYLMISKIGLVPLLPNGKYKKNIPTKQFEYMACGVPVLGADLPSIVPYIKTSHCGRIYNSTSSEALALTALDMLEDEAELDRMAKAGRQAVEEWWNWERMEKRFLHLYAELLH